MQGEEGVIVMGRVEIDTRQPFHSVREAVKLFGEKILAGEVYGNKFKEMQTKANKQQHPKLGAVTAELEETKQSLEKAKEEGNLMVHCLTSLRQELEQTKRELHQLKAGREAIINISHLDADVEPAEIEELNLLKTPAKWKRSSSAQKIMLRTDSSFRRKEVSGLQVH